MKSGDHSHAITTEKLGLDNPFLTSKKSILLNKKMYLSLRVLLFCPYKLSWAEVFQLLTLLRACKNKSKSDASLEIHM